ncbi:MAG: FtsQ-type POTRA domain-containing protein [Syntrophobacteria bacterium]
MQISLPFEAIQVKSKKNSYRNKRLQLYRRLRLVAKIFLVLLAFVALSALCLVGYRALLTSPLLQVTRIQVNGYQQLDPQAVIQQAEIPSGVNILSLDLDEVRNRLTQHPWIAAAAVSREIPDRIRIEIEERKPVALVKGHQFYLADQQGTCFAVAAPSEHAGLPIITGLDPESLGSGCNLPREFTVLFENLYRETQLKLPWRLISEIRWNRNAGLSFFTARGGIQVDLGSEDYGIRIAKLEKVLRYLEKKGLQTQLRGIDLTHGKRVFVRGRFKIPKQNRSQQKGV